jgi:hypothetical protein
MFKLFNKIKKDLVLKEVKPINKIKKACSYCKGTGLVDHENAEFRTVLYWCNCKKPKNLQSSERFNWLDYSLKDDHSYSVHVSNTKENEKVILPDIDSVFEPSIFVCIDEEQSIKFVERYIKKYTSFNNKLYWEFVNLQHFNQLDKDFQIKILNKRLFKCTQQEY